jgi:hypothetical protein
MQMPREPLMDKSGYCMDALRHLARSPSLDPAGRVRVAERAIEYYLEQADSNTGQQRRTLLAIDDAIEIEVTKSNSDEFWSAVQGLIAQRLNDLPDRD